MHVAQTPASVIAHTQTADVRTQRVWYVDFNMFYYCSRYAHSSGAW
jgi:hypothetical protein